ncbi:GyrI-like domain-containing protein [Aquimarina sp. RZ0]|uniref:GyrI-like domain-containing protein n=1 Tax=Aquimarina sp. RZ0 TaxID=2607730 RepID=UPI0011F21C52|nr:GyrI-like domain-containing protein [Aquimarina sp. RZ0]KAA1244093.1 GyrI-like domain-containing protein [Aquimarina sp. RZ0]
MKKIIVVILVSLLGVSVWYLWIKKYDYQVSFKVNTAPGSLYYNTLEIESWGIFEENEPVSIIETTLLKNIRQKVDSHEDSYILDWHFKPVEDTITKITVGFVSEQKSIKNRLSVLTGSADFVKLYKKQMTEYRAMLHDFTKKFRIHIHGIDEVPPIQYAYSSVKTKRTDKANEMIKMNRDLYPKLYKIDKIKKFFPLITVEHWDFKSDSIQFNYGFPVTNKDSLEVYPDIKYKERASRKALKATYFGNYRNSDQAWFSLLEYADRNNISVEKTPIEIFYNNPMHGGDELKWKTEIFLPIIKK